MTAAYDAGALIAAERGDREIFTSDPDDLQALASRIHPTPTIRVI